MEQQQTAPEPVREDYVVSWDDFLDLAAASAGAATRLDELEAASPPVFH